jgi:hypothetical protein
VAKNILKWNIPPGISHSHSRSTSTGARRHVSSAEEFKSILLSLSGAAPADTGSLGVSNNAAISQLVLLAIREALKWVDSGGAHYKLGEFADMFRAFWVALSSPPFWFAMAMVFKAFLRLQWLFGSSFASPSAALAVSRSASAATRVSGERA